jgi:hypothetical protein
MTCLRQAGQRWHTSPPGRVALGKTWNGQGGYAAGMTEAPAPVPMRAVEQGYGCSLALAGYEAFATTLDQ